MKATMYGWEMVCEKPIGSGPSASARSRLLAGTKRSRGTDRMAATTAGSLIPRASICSRTMRSRLRIQSSADSASKASGPSPASGTTTASHLVAHLIAKRVVIRSVTPRLS